MSVTHDRKQLREKLVQIEESERCECVYCGHKQRHYSASLGMRAPGKYWRRCEGCTQSFDYAQEDVFRESSLLEEKAKSCGTPPPDGAEYVLHGRPCNCRFCDQCCERLGYQLRDSVREVMKDWKNPRLWTLTIDRTLFESPEAAFRYVRDHRCISELMRTLRRGGYIDHYICVIEYHADGWPHWHFVVDASFIPHDLVYERWGKFRPAGSGPVRHASKCQCCDCIEGSEIARPQLMPAFGAVNFSSGKKFHDSAHACHYITKYIIKQPRHGYPDWVLDAKGIKIARYQTSRGFFGTAKPKKEKEKEKQKEELETPFEAGGRPVPDVHDGDCFCDSCRGEELHPEPVKGVRPVRLRLSECRETAVILRRRFDGLRYRYSYFSNCRIPRADAMEYLQVDRNAKSTTLGLPFAMYLAGHVKTSPDKRWDYGLHGTKSCDVENVAQKQLFD